MKTQKSGTGATAVVSPKEMMNLISDLLQSMYQRCVPNGNPFPLYGVLLFFIVYYFFLRVPLRILRLDLCLGNRLYVILVAM